MGKVVACIIARTVSKRLPLKVLRSIGDEYSMLDFLIKRLQRVVGIDEIFICTSVEPVDDIMEDIAVRTGVQFYRGSPDKVIERMLAVGSLTGADILLRITGDNPLTSTEYIDDQIRLMRDKDLDYVRLIDVPIGATAEIIRRSALIKCNEQMDPSVSEYLMLFIFEPLTYKCGVIKPFEKDFSNMTITVDTPADLQRTASIFKHHRGSALEISLQDIVDILQVHQIPNSYLSGGGKIKLPYGKTVEFEEFNLDMRRRIEQSENISLYA